MRTFLRATPRSRALESAIIGDRQCELPCAAEWESRAGLNFAFLRLEVRKMADYRALDYVRCRLFLDARATTDEQVKNIKAFVENWPALVLAADTQNFVDHKRSLDRLDALASRAAAERLNLLG